MAMADPYDLQRFVDAQHMVYAHVVAELGRGEKQSHWMWFIFPQIAGLGFSAMAQRFALASAEEAGTSRGPGGAEDIHEQAGRPHRRAEELHRAARLQQQHADEMRAEH